MFAIYREGDEMINTLDAEDITDRIQDRLWKHDGYFGYADAMKIVEEELRSGTVIQVLPELATLRVGVDCAIERSHRERLCEQLFLQALHDAIDF